MAETAALLRRLRSGDSYVRRHVYETTAQTRQMLADAQRLTKTGTDHRSHRGGGSGSVECYRILASGQNLVGATSWKFSDVHRRFGRGSGMDFQQSVATRGATSTIRIVAADGSTPTLKPLRSRVRRNRPRRERRRNGDGCQSENRVQEALRASENSRAASWAR